MNDSTGDSAHVHENGLDESDDLLREPVTLEQLAEAVRDVESRLRREHAEKRAAFEARLTQKFTDLLDEFRAEYVHLKAVTPEEITR